MNIKRLFWIIVGIIAFLLLYLTYKQFYLWQENEISRFLLPPYNSWNYFVFYALTRFWAPYLVSWTAGLIFFGGFYWMNKRRGSRFFYNEELYFLWTAVFLSGHPGWILYFPILFLLAITEGLFHFVCNDGRKTSFFYLWLPAAGIVILLNQWLLINWEWYLKLLL